MPNTTSCLAATRIYLFYVFTPPTLSRFRGSCCGWNSDGCGALVHSQDLFIQVILPFHSSVSIIIRSTLRVPSLTLSQPKASYSIGQASVVAVSSDSDSDTSPRISDVVGEKSVTICIQKVFTQVSFHYFSTVRSGSETDQKNRIAKKARRGGGIRAKKEEDPQNKFGRCDITTERAGFPHWNEGSWDESS